ncbi:PadR family transcriptional regulator [Rhodococcus sp. NPDC003318]|uniref:PadR family transcriptional regulator n=1 Tax=Rhodococcus sp. NPDC003318 TaxID=3364503 RepID=UPI0036CCC3B4
MTVTPLAITVLALLNERDMHPYEMYQVLQQRRGDRLVKLRPGSLYHTVARLDRDEMVVAVGTDRDGNRPERTTYAITDAGRRTLRERVTEMLGQPVREYPQFPLALAEAHNLDRDTVVRLLTDRIGRLEQDLAELDASRTAVAELGKPRAFWLELDYLRAVARTEIDWLRGTVDELDDGALPWITPDLVRAQLTRQARD